jgi:hypothetical protein
MRRGTIAAALVLLCAASSVAVSSARLTDARAEVERALRTTARTARLPRSLTVTFSERPGRRDFWCCESFTLRGNGRLTRSGLGPTDAPETITVRISKQEVVGVVRLLVGLDAWRQRRTPHPPNASRAILRIRVGASSTVIWAWQDRNGKSPRIGLVRARLSQLWNTHR